MPHARGGGLCLQSIFEAGIEVGIFFGFFFFFCSTRTRVHAKDHQGHYPRDWWRGGGIAVNLRYMRTERWPVTWDRSSFFGSYKEVWVVFEETKSLN